MSELKPCPMTADEAISALEMCQALMLFDPMTGETHELCEENKDNQDLYNACSLAIDALRRAQLANEPLTIEQLREMEQRGEGIYVTHADGSPIFRGKQYTAAVLDRIAAFGAMGYRLQAIYGRGLTLAEDDCGKTWLAYAHKPGGEQE